MVTIIDNKAIASTTGSGQTQASGSPVSNNFQGMTGGNIAAANPTPAAPASSTNNNVDVRALTQAAVNGDASAASKLSSMGLTNLSGYATALGITKTPATATTVGNSASNLPSSSATSTLNANGQNAVGNAIVPPKAAPVDLNVQAYIDYYAQNGVTLSADQVAKKFEADPTQLADFLLNVKQAEKSERDQKAAADAQTAADNASNDENMRVHQQTIDTQRQGALTQIKALEYAANPFAKTTSTTSANVQMFTKKFDDLQVNLNNSYALAKQAIASGHTQAYASIMASIGKTLQDNAKSTTAALNQIKAQQQQQEQYTTTENRLNTRFTQTMTDKYVDDYQTALTKNQYTSSALDKMTDSQILASPAGKIAALQEQTDGTPVSADQIRAVLKSAQIANEKLLIQQQNAAASASRAAIAQANYSNNLTTTDEIKSSLNFSSQGIPYLISSQFNGTQFNQARNVANQSGAAFITQAQADQVDNIQLTKANQKAMFDQIKSSLPADWADRLAKTPGIKLSQLLQSDTTIAAFNSAWQDHAVQLARALAGTAGLRISQQFIDNSKAALIKPTDTLQIALQKMNTVDTQLNNIESAVLGNKKPVDGYGTTAAGSAATKQVQYQGKMYNVDANGDMTPV